MVFQSKSSGYFINSSFMILDICIKILSLFIEYYVFSKILEYDILGSGPFSVCTGQWAAFP